MNIKCILEQEHNFIDLSEAVVMLSGVEVYHIADFETGEIIIKGATAQDIIALSDRGVYGISLTVPYGDICATIFLKFYGNEAEDLKNYTPEEKGFVNFYRGVIETK